MRSSINARRADFFIPFTALIIVSGLTSIFNASAITRLLPLEWRNATLYTSCLPVIMFEARSWVKLYGRYGNTQTDNPHIDGAVWRRRAGSNRCIAVLQTAPLTTWVRRPRRIIVWAMGERLEARGAIYRLLERIGISFPSVECRSDSGARGSHPSFEGATASPFPSASFSLAISSTS